MIYIYISAYQFLYVLSVGSALDPGKGVGSNEPFLCGSIDRPSAVISSTKMFYVFLLIHFDMGR
jgi:hypothetical protein